MVINEHGSTDGIIGLKGQIGFLALKVPESK